MIELSDSKKCYWVLENGLSVCISYFLIRSYRHRVAKIWEESTFMRISSVNRLHEICSRLHHSSNNNNSPFVLWFIRVCISYVLKRSYKHTVAIQEERNYCAKGNPYKNKYYKLSSFEEPGNIWCTSCSSSITFDSLDKTQKYYSLYLPSILKFMCAFASNYWYHTWCKFVCFNNSL